MASSFAPDLQFIGPPLSDGPLPAIFYFALSAHDSLHLDPFNQPVEAWKKHPVRVFSIDLPAHGPGEDKMEAMSVWAKQLTHDPVGYFEPFFFRFGEVLKELAPYIDADNIAVAGLSRGGFIATHLAARFPVIKSVLGFAPATKLIELKGFPSEASQHDLVHLIPKLKHITLKFYIGNHDILVNTQDAWEFCRDLAEHKFQNGERSPQVYFSMYPSIGHRGHGTPPGVFQEGAQWLITQG